MTVSRKSRDQATSNGNKQHSPLLYKSGVKSQRVKKAPVDVASGTVVVNANTETTPSDFAAVVTKMGEQQTTTATSMKTAQ